MERKEVFVEWRRNGKHGGPSACFADGGPLMTLKLSSGVWRRGAHERRHSKNSVNQGTYVISIKTISRAAMKGSTRLHMFSMGTPETALATKRSMP